MPALPRASGHRVGQQDRQQAAARSTGGRPPASPGVWPSAAIAGPPKESATTLKQVAPAPRTAAAIPAARRRVSATCEVTAPDPDHHRRSAHHRDREQHSPIRAEVPPGAERSCRPPVTRSISPAGCSDPEQARARRPRPSDRSGQHHLGPPLVLLAAQDPRHREDRPDRPDEGQHQDDPPLGESGDGFQRRVSPNRAVSPGLDPMLLPGSPGPPGSG